MSDMHYWVRDPMRRTLEHPAYVQAGQTINKWLLEAGPPTAHIDEDGHLRFEERDWPESVARARKLMQDMITAAYEQAGRDYAAALREYRHPGSTARQAISLMNQLDELPEWFQRSTLWPPPPPEL